MVGAQRSPQLGARLRELRTAAGWDLTQRQLATALGVSPALLSTWEKATAVPAPKWLALYASFFATRRSLAEDGPRLLPSDELTPDEQREVDALARELIGLRGGPADAEPDASRPGFWTFPDSEPITILCGPLSNRQLGLSPDGSVPADAPPITAYSRNTHPNYIDALRTGDLDALLALLGELHRQNPESEITWKATTSAESDDLTGHVIVLGGTDSEELLTGEVGQLVGLLGLPVTTRVPDKADAEYGSEFVVATQDGVPTVGGSEQEIVRPGFRLDPSGDRVEREGFPVLTDDVALVTRSANPLKLSAHIILAMGIFSRGTYGAVRAWTDPRLRESNERVLAEQVPDPGNFWMLLRVPVIGTSTVTPDLSRPSARIFSSAGPASA